MVLRRICRNIARPSVIHYATGVRDMVNNLPNYIKFGKAICAHNNCFLINSGLRLPSIRRLKQGIRPVPDQCFGMWLAMKFFCVNFIPLLPFWASIFRIFRGCFISTNCPIYFGFFRPHHNWDAIFCAILTATIQQAEQHGPNHP